MKYQTPCPNYRIRTRLTRGGPSAKEPIRGRRIQERKEESKRIRVGARCHESPILYPALLVLIEIPFILFLRLGAAGLDSAVSGRIATMYHLAKSLYLYATSKEGKTVAGIVA